MREALEALPPLNIFRTLAHAETCLRPALRLGQAILTRQELDAVLRELAILRVAQLTGAQYEWVQHVAIGRAVRGDRRPGGRAGARGRRGRVLHDRARLILRLTTQLVEDDAIAQDALDTARETFSDREIVELILTCGYYGCWPR